jgi:HK97 gp10 family phage protein
MAMKGLNKHKRRLRKLSSASTVRLMGASLYAGGDAIRSEAFRSISAGSVSGKNHVASTPGESPNRDTGNLQARLKTEQPKPLTVEVRSEAEYAAALEFGTSKMAARPYMRPARDKMLTKVRKDFASAFDNIVKASGS